MKFVLSFFFFFVQKGFNKNNNSISISNEIVDHKKMTTTKKNVIE